MSSLFNWLLLALCIGGAVSLTLIVWIQDERGWDSGFGISAVAILCGVIVFLAGIPLFRIHAANGTSAIVEIIQVYVAAILNRKLELHENPIELYEVEPGVAGETEFLLTGTFTGSWTKQPFKYHLLSNPELRIHGNFAV
ncbi:hypothetical protein SLE2022_304780 [Rubroshorea leprosula]